MPFVFVLFRDIGEALALDVDVHGAARVDVLVRVEAFAAPGGELVHPHEAAREVGARQTLERLPIRLLVIDDAGGDQASRHRLTFAMASTSSSGDGFVR